MTGSVVGRWDGIRRSPRFGMSSICSRPTDSGPLQALERRFEYLNVLARRIGSRGICRKEDGR